MDVGMLVPPGRPQVTESLMDILFFMNELFARQSLAIDKKEIRMDMIFSLGISDGFDDGWLILQSPMDHVTGRKRVWHRDPTTHRINDCDRLIMIVDQAIKRLFGRSSGGGIQSFCGGKKFGRTACLSLAELPMLKPPIILQEVIIDCLCHNLVWWIIWKVGWSSLEHTRSRVPPNSESTFETFSNQNAMPQLGSGNESFICPIGFDGMQIGLQPAQLLEPS